MVPITREQVKDAKGSRTEIISPKLAVQWLKLNDCNRNLSKSRVKHFVRIINAGEWSNSGDPIRFSTNGSLLNGQHRLNALIEAGIPLEFDLRFGLEPKSMDSMDTNKKRTAGDVFSMHGITDPHNAAAAARKVMEVLQLSKPPFTNDEILAFFKENDDFGFFLSEGRSFYRASGHLISSSRFAAYYFLMARTDEEKAQSFLSKVATGVGLQKECPSLELRNRIVKSKMSGRAGLSAHYEEGLFAKAWNLYLKGRKVKSLRFLSSETPMSF